MADTKISALTANSTPAFADLLATIDDPGGTPISKKTTIEELLTASVAAANTSLFSPTGYSLTGADASPAIDLAGTWNTTGTPTAIKLNVTDTASNAASLLMDLQLGGSSIFSIAKTGRIDITYGNDRAFTFRSGANGFRLNGFGISGLQIERGDAAYVARILSEGSRFAGYVGIGAAVGSSSQDDTFLYRDAANTLALRNSTNAQTLNIYNTYTDASNYERLAIKWATNVATIIPENAGTGSARTLAINFNASGSSNAKISLSGTSMVFTVSNTANVVLQNGFLRPSGTACDLGSVSVPWPRIVGTTFQVHDGVAVSSLPTPAVGMVARVTDANAPAVGSTVSGGGAAAALVWYNGSNWTVIGV